VSTAEIFEQAIADLRITLIRDRREADHTRLILLKLVRRLVDRGAITDNDCVDMIIALGKGNSVARG
jgi:hypothetical protein